MKKILLALLVVSSSSAFAAVPDATYTINTQLYSVEGGSKHLVSSISEIVNNDGKENPSFSLREVGAKELNLKDEVRVSSTVVKGEKGNVLHYSGRTMHVKDLNDSDDAKWHSGNVQVLSFSNTMNLNKDREDYHSSFEADGKKYLLEMKANKVDYVADLNPESKKQITDFVFIQSTQEKGQGCSPDGLTSKDKQGDTVKCADGVWK